MGALFSVLQSPLVLAAIVKSGLSSFLTQLYHGLVRQMRSAFENQILGGSIALSLAQYASKELHDVATAQKEFWRKTFNGYVYKTITCDGKLQVAAILKWLERRPESQVSGECKLEIDPILMLDGDNRALADACTIKPTMAQHIRLAYNGASVWMRITKSSAADKVKADAVADSPELQKLREETTGGVASNAIEIITFAWRHDVARTIIGDAMKVLEAERQRFVTFTLQGNSARCFSRWIRDRPEVISAATDFMVLQSDSGRRGDDDDGDADDEDGESLLEFVPVLDGGRSITFDGQPFVYQIVKAGSNVKLIASMQGFANRKEVQDRLVTPLVQAGQTLLDDDNREWADYSIGHIQAEYILKWLDSQRNAMQTSAVNMRVEVDPEMTTENPFEPEVYIFRPNDKMQSYTFLYMGKKIEVKVTMSTDEAALADSAGAAPTRTRPIRSREGNDGDDSHPPPRRVVRKPRPVESGPGTVRNVRLKSRDPAVMSALLNTGRELVQAEKQTSTHMFAAKASEMSSGRTRWKWNKVASRPRRRMESVILDAGDGERILQDCKEFLSMRGWYVERGIPYRRGYMLEGLPGTGKTSLVRALAGELGLDLYYLNLNAEGLSSQQLDELLRTTSENAIIVLEEVDEAFKKLAEEEIAVDNVKAQSKRQSDDAATVEKSTEASEGTVSEGADNHDTIETSEETAKPKGARVQKSHKFGGTTVRKASVRRGEAKPDSDDPGVALMHSRGDGASIGRGSLDLTGILTAFDGLWSQEGRLVFSTTNNYETIAAIRQGALVRCGRFGDYRLHFTALTHHQAQQLFRHFYKPGHYRPDGVVVKRIDTADDDLAVRTMSTNEVQEQAVQFADLIKAKLLDNEDIPLRRKVYNSVQSFLMTRARSDRMAALNPAVVDEWIQSLLSNTS
eukprot:m.209921 g.209921  ORF g.209921 m.209921 type:complete len:911 (+) comp15478_c1_seq8:133-2865(+)